MFDIEELVSECKRAAHHGAPSAAIKEVLERTLRRHDVARALPVTRAEVVPLFASPDLSILKVVWAPGMSFRPHNHLMWAAIGLYCGQEDNVFYRRRADGLEQAGGQELHMGDVAVLGPTIIHAVRNPRTTFTAAIHVYGGDIAHRPGRSEWDEETYAEVPYDFERTREKFERANASADLVRASSG